LTFELGIAVGQIERRFHSCIISLQGQGELSQFTYAAALRSC
jgi:hypothetical protein